jgi:hypothetical protein
VLAQERHGQQAGVDRRGRHEQAGRARGHHPLPGVEQQQVRLLWPAEPVTRQIFTVSRRGGDRKPAVRVVLDALAAEAARPPANAATAA